MTYEAGVQQTLRDVETYQGLAPVAFAERSEDTPRILVLAPDLESSGGIERFGRTLIDALTALYGPKAVGVLCLRGVRPDLQPSALSYGFTRRPLRVGLRARTRFTLASMATARRWHRNLILVATHPHLGPVAWLCGRVSGAPYVVWAHGKECWGRIRPSVRVALRSAAAVVAVSRFTARAIESRARVASSRMHVVPHCVPEEFRPQASISASRQDLVAMAAPIVLTVARLRREDAYKGVDTLLLCWPRVRAQVPKAELWVVGDGPDRNNLETTARAPQLDGSIRFLGEVSDRDLRVLYSRARVFALPSRFCLQPRPQGEGFGLVYIEAGAAGLPVVGGNGGGIPEAVINGETGLLVDPEDADAVADAIVLLLCDRDLAARLGEAGKRRAESEFSYLGFVRRVGSLIDNLAFSDDRKTTMIAERL